MDTITVEGERSREESERSSRASQSVLIEPRESSRFDITTQLKRESSLDFAETGRISPSGFIIPKIRGQDSKLTDVYLEDTLLQDPYSGMPLIEDLDLRAFGSLELHQGLSPIDVPNLNPIGTLRYRFSHEPLSRASLGMTAGNPHGSSLWGLAISKSDSREIRLYARKHQTTGKYRYYSDESTPFNPADDRFRIRANNDQRSEQIVPVYREAWGPYALQAMAWFYRADSGIASASRVIDSAARDHTKGYLGDITLQRSWTDVLAIDSLQLSAHAARTEDKRLTEDPQQVVLNSSRQASMTVDSDRQGTHLKAETERTRTLLSYERSESAIKQSFESVVGTALQRTNAVAIASLGLVPWDKILLEFKHSEQTQGDVTDERLKVVFEEEKGGPKSHKSAKGDALSLAWGDYTDGLYGQMARTERLPSLFEEFGNGNDVRPNDSLKAEQIFHRELGGFSRALGLNWGVAAYNDSTDEKIIIIPILANASKALNVAKTRIQGYDGSVSWLGESTTLSLKGSKLEAFDTSRRTKRIIPGTPELILVAEWREQWSAAGSTYLTSRYRSDVYRDLGNSFKLPGSTIFDLNADYKWRRIELGLAVRNVLDTTDVEISAGSSRGRTGLSDFAGYPLPGRQWVLSLVYSTAEKKL